MSDPTYINPTKPIELSLPYVVARYGMDTLLVVLERGEVRVEGTRVLSPVCTAAREWLGRGGEGLL